MGRAMGIRVRVGGRFFAPKLDSKVGVPKIKPQITGWN